MAAAPPFRQRQCALFASRLMPAMCSAAARQPGEAAGRCNRVDRRHDGARDVQGPSAICRCLALSPAHHPPPLFRLPLLAGKPGYTCWTWNLQHLKQQACGGCRSAPASWSASSSSRGRSRRQPPLLPRLLAASSAAGQQLSRLWSWAAALLACLRLWIWRRLASRWVYGLCGWAAHVSPVVRSQLIKSNY